MRPKSTSAFSLVEVLLAFSVVGILSFLAFVTISRVVSSSKEQKLTSDVDALNRAVMAYIASGGDLAASSTAEEVLTAMKRQAASGTRTPGFSGAMVDSRLAFVYDSDESTSGPRIYWNNHTRRFEVDSGRSEPGIVSVSLDGGEWSEEGGGDSRGNPLLYADKGSWIWDYSDVPLPDPNRPTDIDVNPAPDTNLPPPPGDPPRNYSTPLDPPIYSIRGGDFPKSSFDLKVKLSDPNPAGAGEIYYSINYGNWIRYSGPVVLQPGAVLAAQTVPLKEEYTSSARLEEIYRQLRQTLVAPSIQLSATEFTDKLDTIGVRLTNPNPEGASRLFYNLVEPGASPGDRKAWFPYNGDIVALSTQFPAGFTIHAYARANDVTAYLDSPSTSADAGASFTFEDPGDGLVLYVIDASGSMNGKVGSTTKFRLVQNALIDAIGRLRPGTKFNVVTFAGNLVWYDGSWDLKPLTPESQAAMIKEVDRFKTSSGTNYEAGLSAPLRFKTKPETVFFLTDGEPTGGTKFDDDVQALAKAGIKVNTIGVDLKNSGEARLASIAKATGGSSTTVSTK